MLQNSFFLTNNLLSNYLLLLLEVLGAEASSVSCTGSSVEDVCTVSGFALAFQEARSSSVIARQTLPHSQTASFGMRPGFSSLILSRPPLLDQNI